MEDIRREFEQNPNLKQLQILLGDEPEEGEFPWMLIIVFGACIVAAAWMGILYLTNGNDYVTLILGNHPQRT